MKQGESHEAIEQDWLFHETAMTSRRDQNRQSWRLAIGMRIGEASRVEVVSKQDVEEMRSLVCHHLDCCSWQRFETIVDSLHSELEFVVSLPFCSSSLHQARR